MEKKRFCIKVCGRAGLVYKENEHQMKVDSEMLSGNEIGIVIFKNSINKWQPPYENEVLTEEERHAILVNIVTNFERLNYKVFVSPSY